MKISELLGKKQVKPYELVRQDYSKQLNTLTQELKDVRANFNEAGEEQTIEALIYEENSLLCRLDALYCEAREKGITLQPHERLK